MSLYKIVLFAYNFPHQKSVDFIHTFYKNNFTISLIIAADFISIKSPKSAFCMPQKTMVSSTKKVAEEYSIPFYVAAHNSSHAESLIKKYAINLGVIAGARILHSSIISAIKYGILNFHPGLLPDVRGLDSILWSIYNDFPIGVTAHFIEEKIDSGKMIIQKKISIDFDDSLISIYKKNYQLQLDLIPISLNLVLNKFDFLPIENDGEYNTKMPYNIQLELKNKIGLYIKKHANS